MLPLHHIRMNRCATCDIETRNPKFCCKSCSAKYNNSLRPKPLPRQPIPCEWCGAPHLRDGRFCSRQCQATKHTPEERARIVRARNREACARYAAKKKNQTPEWADLAAIKLFYYNCPEGYEVDHIKPITKGGLHDLPNLQYLTKSENRKKSAKWDGD